MFESTLKDTYWLMKTNLFPAWKKDRGFQALREKVRSPSRKMQVSNLSCQTAGT